MNSPKATVNKSYLLPGLIGAMIINLALFGVLPGLIHMEKKSSDLESLNLVNFTRIKPQPPEPKPKEEKKEKEPEKQPEKIHNIAHQKQQVPKRQLKLNMPELDLDIDPRISGGIPMISAPREPVAQAAPGPDFSAIMDQDAVDTIPVPTFKRNPRYPYRAKRMGLEGEVKIQFLVSKQGVVSQIKILDSQPPGVFDQSVLNAVSSWKYAPGELMGRKVATRVTTSIIFKMEGQ